MNCQKSVKAIYFNFYLLCCYVLFVISSEIQTEDSEIREVREDSDVYSVLRMIDNKGFHRELTTNISLKLNPGNEESKIACQLMLVETIPSSMYVDLYEIEALKDWGGPEVTSEKRFDVEKPEYLCSDQSIRVYSSLKYNNGHLEASIKIPVHLRYHKPIEGGSHVSVHLRNPKIFTNCSTFLALPMQTENHEFPCSAKSHETCPWGQVLLKEESESLLLLIPIGKLDQKTVVLFGTAFAALCGIYILASALVANSVPVEIKKEH